MHRDPNATRSSRSTTLGVNLIGEHTDSQEGYVLPTPIPQRTHETLRPRNGRVAREVMSLIRDGKSTRSPRPGRGWLDHVAGTTATVARERVPPPGFNVEIASRVPLGAGVSSSAALRPRTTADCGRSSWKIVFRRVLNEYGARPIPATRSARRPRWATRHFVSGVRDTMPLPSLTVMIWFAGTF